MIHSLSETVQVSVCILSFMLFLLFFFLTRSTFFLKEISKDANQLKGGNKQEETLKNFTVYKPLWRNAVEDHILLKCPHH